MNKSLIGLIAVSTVFLIYVTGFYTNFQSDSALEVIDFSIDKPASENSIPSNPDRIPLYGDLHVHTKYSFDAYIFGVTATPYDAYKYATGEAIKHPLGFDMKLREPLDFYAVTDHGFYMGMIENYADTSSEMSKKEWTKPMHNINRPENVNVESLGERADLFSSVLSQAIVQPYPYWHPKLWKAWFTNNIQVALKSFDYDVHKSAWADVANAAEEFNDPGNFTTFIGYEFTTSTEVEGGNLHRNVIFNSSNAPIRPWTRIDSLNPEDLWTWMDSLRDKGVDSLAMPHNSNGSNGQMFEVETFRGNPISIEYAEKRMRNEPVVEMTQVKGTSDTHPLLSPDDEWADFEIMDKRVGSRPPTYSMPQGGYVRDAYLRGLTLDWEGRGNPYKFGLIGSSDTHTGAGGFDEDNYWSKAGVLDGTDMGRGSVPLTQDRIDMLNQYADLYNQPISIQEIDGRTYADVGFDQWSASGLAVAWAEENTRDSIFQAFKRKETFATTGTRMALRFFAGFDMESIDLDSEDMVKNAYAKGVTMGADLFSQDNQTPQFLVWAQRDKLGAPLQRVQIIKGWVESASGTPKEQIYDVACSDGLLVDPVTNRCPDNGARVNISDCSISNDVGAGELKTIWTDPDFDPTIKAFYYVRVLENPTCRWSTWDSIKAGVTPRPDLHQTIQERAWSSPIWYIPESGELNIIPL
ncbi:MAG: DUF3604 domain-containing protein [Gammaproteobacteria bacterium]|jgi:hypothetical protein|nr:DUF3604 domain-containing protein [Gammaproteobacteria bacterium]MDC0512841.1 DUF3604 domain-containing protein [Gammaproteobacteria bacterium]MDC0902111.1 DUF3604 domain-containing protein [Gammaproteobacteria bacterium]MDC1043047.1 DUF3604 domain-containing protein [Gammaproteobacteria bacterium]MDO7701408.1 DUF3604 domain-containing protein [SAR86 cluster bacterium]|tara:strand:- start:2044 stop:4119 length:2076 start_codon:yes stop_codon:yes gene_type:complete